MILLEPPPAPTDLNWKMFGIPVRANIWFWISTAILTYRQPSEAQPITLWPIAILCVFVSILVHEYGHAFARKYYGDTSNYIVLWGLGGLSIGQREPSRTSAKILISLWGPLAGFILGGIVIGVAYAIGYRLQLPMTWMSPFNDLHGAVAISTLFFVNLIWGAVNLLPVFPLDGGQVMYHWLGDRYGHDGQTRSFYISLITASVAAVIFLVLQWWVPAVMFGMLAYNSHRAWMHYKMGGGRGEAPEPETREPWERDPDWWRNSGGKKDRDY